MSAVPPSLGSLSMLMARVSEVQRVSEWTHRVEADIVGFLIRKGGTVSRDSIHRDLPYKRQEINIALKWMVFSGVIVSGRGGEVTLVGI